MFFLCWKTLGGNAQAKLFSNLLFYVLILMFYQTFKTLGVCVTL